MNEWSLREDLVGKSFKESLQHAVSFKPSPLEGAMLGISRSGMIGLGALCCFLCRQCQSGIGFSLTGCACSRD